MAGRADYAERRQERIDRLTDAAERACKESDAAYQRSHDLVKNIPLGQPNIARSGRTAERSFTGEGYGPHHGGRVHQSF